MPREVVFTRKGKSGRKLLLALGVFLLTCGGLVSFATTINIPHRTGQPEFNPLNIFNGSYAYYRTGRSGGRPTLQDFQDTRALRNLHNELDKQLKQYVREQSLDR